MTDKILYLILILRSHTAEAALDGSSRIRNEPFLEVSRRHEEGGNVAEKVIQKLSLLKYVQLNGEELGRDAEIEGQLRCFCDTPECTQSQSCLTSGSCYTQILLLDDASPPITRGCINGETPLLCENRRPRNPGPYPTLRCCKSNFCNHPPPNKQSTDYHQITQAFEHAWTQGPTESHLSPTLEGHLDQAKDAFPKTRTFERKLVQNKQPSSTSSSFQISPAARIALIVAGVSVIVISAIGIFCLCRELTHNPDNSSGTDPSHNSIETLQSNETQRKVKGREGHNEKEFKLLLMFPESSV